MINQIPEKILIVFFFFFFISNSIAQDNVALFYSDYTAKALNDSVEVNDQITFWEFFLIKNNINYKVIYDDELESGISDDFSLLILPSAKCLSDNQISSIQNFLNEGGSVFAQKNIGFYNKNGLYKGTGFLESSFGLKYDSEIPHNEIINIHTFLGNNPLTFNIPPGFRLPLLTDSKIIKSKVTSLNTKALGFWYNDSLPFKGELKKILTTGIAYGSSGEGKFVWTGFDSRAVSREKLHQEIFNTFLLNSLNWLFNKTSAWIETWPNGYKAAVILSGDVESQFENINNVLDIMEEENAQGEFYILTDEIKSETMKRILKNGDIGVHGDNHNIFKWQDYETQFQRLKKSIKILEDSAGKNIIAFRPPETEYDEATIRVLKECGIKILASDFFEDRAVPQFMNNEEIMIMPKTGFDDYDLLYRLQLNNYVEQAERYLTDYRRVFEEGGLYTLYYHSQIQSSKNNVDALRICINQFKNDKVWITTSNQVYNWWKGREKISINIVENSGSSFKIQLKNNAEFVIKNAQIVFSENDLKNSNISIRDNKGEKINYIYNKDDKTIGILVEEILAYEIKNFTISLENFN